MYCHQNYDADFFSFLIGAGLLSYSSPKVEPITEPPIVENTKVEDNIKFYSQAWDQIMNQGKKELFNDSIFIPDVLFKNKIAPDPFLLSSLKSFCNGIRNKKQHYKPLNPILKV